MYTMFTMKHGLRFWRNTNNLHNISDCYAIVMQKHYDETAGQEVAKE